jgi:hypothetical protein
MLIISQFKIEQFARGKKNYLMAKYFAGKKGFGK